MVLSCCIFLSFHDISKQTTELMLEKQMEVCKVCGAFLIVGDAPARLDDHMQGKQHVGYQRLRNAVDEIMVHVSFIL